MKNLWFYGVFVVLFVLAFNPPGGLLRGAAPDLTAAWRQTASTPVLPASFTKRAKTGIERELGRASARRRH